MNISAIGQQYPFASLSAGQVRPVTTESQNVAATDSGDTAVAADTGSVSSNGRSWRSGHHHHQHHDHGHHDGPDGVMRRMGEGHFHATAAARLEGKFGDRVEQHAAAAKEFDDAVDTLTQQVSTVLGELPEGATEQQAQQVADLQSGFIESIRNVAAHFRVHDLGSRGAQAGIQNAFEMLKSGVETIFPADTAEARSATVSGEAVMVEEVPAQSVGGQEPVGDTPVTDVSVPVSTATEIGTDAEGGVSLQNALDQVYVAVQESLRSGLEALMKRTVVGLAENVRQAFDRFAAFYQEISVVVEEPGAAGTASESHGINLVA